ncbi:hypothetical protein Ancab_014851, partial [Ancistrocladus abbreviatus]
SNIYGMTTIVVLFTKRVFLFLGRGAAAETEAEVDHGGRWGGGDEGIAEVEADGRVKWEG